MIQSPINRRTFLGTSAAFGAAILAKPWASLAAGGDTLRIRVARELGTLDPLNMTGGLEEELMRSIYVTLVTLDDVRKGSGLINWGAEEIEQVDPLQIRFRLIEGLQWSDGYGPVTADDVKFSFERIADPEMESAWNYMFEMLEEVEVVDDRTGIIRLSEPFSPIWWMSLPWYGGHIISRAATEAVGGSFGPEPPATCGPYRIESWSPREKVVLRANPDWPGPAVDFETVECLMIDDEESARIAYEAGAVDYTGVSIAAARHFRENPPEGTRFIEAQSSHYVWVTVNMEHPKLQDPRVRQALQYAFDAQTIITGVYDDLVPRSAGIAQPGTFGARESNLIEEPDYQRARELLAEAGAENLELDLSVMNSTTHLAIAQIIQATMAQAGITINIEPFDEGTYWSLGDGEGDMYMDQQLILMRFAGGLDPSENMVWFRPDQVGVWNWSRWADDEYEELYQEGVRISDEDERGRIYRRMQDLMEESGAFIFLVHEPLVAVHRDTLEPHILADNWAHPPQFRRIG